MIKILTVITSAIGLVGCSLGLVFGSPSHLSAMRSDALVKAVTLMAREEKMPPPGQPNTLDRPIGFAAVFLQIENPEQEAITVVIEKIQIRDALTGQVKIETDAPQSIHLRPLENSTNDFHLTNQTGYGGGDRLKAVVTYQVNGQRQTIESSPIEVERH